MTNTRKLKIFIGIDLQKVYADKLFDSKDLVIFKRFLVHELEKDYTHRLFVVKENYKMEKGDYSLLNEIEDIKESKGYSVANREHYACHNVISYIMQAVSKLRTEYKDAEVPVIDNITICGLNTSTSVLATVMLIKAFFPTTQINLIRNLCKDGGEYAQHDTFYILQQHIDTITV